ncbi:MAG: hypothetical protein GDA41_07695 [Rhodospirillales bacterium]|nr:hypothetical protein [Rhodospirillales bacterium]
MKGYLQLAAFAMVKFAQRELAQPLACGLSLQNISVAHFNIDGGQIACLQPLGFSACYVNGYPLTGPPNGQPRRIGAAASYAWISIWRPTFGWVDADPTDDRLVADEHVTLTWSRG